MQELERHRENNLSSVKPLAFGLTGQLLLIPLHPVANRLWTPMARGGSKALLFYVLKPQMLMFTTLFLLSQVARLEPLFHSLQQCFFRVDQSKRTVSLIALLGSHLLC